LQPEASNGGLDFFCTLPNPNRKRTPNVATHVRPFKKHQGDDDAAESWKKWMETRNGLKMTDVELNEINDLEFFFDLQLYNLSYVVIQRALHF